MSYFERSIHLFLQPPSSVAACRFVGFVAGQLGQAQVVAEANDGALPGPSPFGASQP